MFQDPPPLLASKPNRKRIHQHHQMKDWVRLPADQRCFEPLGKPFLETAFGKVPLEVRSHIFEHVLTVESPLKAGISVPMTRLKLDCPARRIETKPSIWPARPASCLALLQTCRQIYKESSVLFYSINTMFFSDPHEMLLFLHRLGPVRCNDIRSLHLEDFFKMRNFAWCKPLHLLNKTGKIRKLYLDISPGYAAAFVELCAQIPGLTSCEIAFESLTRWSVMPSSTNEKTTPWLITYLRKFSRDPPGNKRFSAGWLGPYQCRVEVDIHRALPEGRLQSTEMNGRIEGVRSVDTAIEDLGLSP